MLGTFRQTLKQAIPKYITYIKKTKPHTKNIPFTRLANPTNLIISSAMTSPIKYNYYNGNVKNFYEYYENNDGKLSDILFHPKNDIYSQQIEELGIACLNKNILLYEQIYQIDDLDDKGLDYAIDKYELYLQMKKISPETKLVLPLEVELAWQAHMLMNDHYVEFTIDNFGTVIDPHIIIPEKRRMSDGQILSAFFVLYLSGPYFLSIWYHFNPPYYA